MGKKIEMKNWWKRYWKFSSWIFSLFNHSVTRGNHGWEVIGVPTIGRKEGWLIHFPLESFGGSGMGSMCVVNFGLSLIIIIIMNDGDQYFEKKIIFMSKIFGNVVMSCLPIHTRLNLFEAAKWALNSSSPGVIPFKQNGHLFRFCHTPEPFFFFGVIRPFSMSVKGPQKNPFLWYLLKPGDQ